MLMPMLCRVDLRHLLLLACYFCTLASATLRGGFLGPYHPTNKNYPDGSNRTVWDTFHFGVTALENSASEQENWLLADDLSFHCSKHDVNQVMAILIPPSEKGVVNNPSDTKLLTPATPPGLVQGAARFSKLASKCPQLTGIIIDDFLRCQQSKKGHKTQRGRGSTAPQRTQRIGHASLKIFICVCCTAWCAGPDVC